MSRTCLYEVICWLRGGLPASEKRKKKMHGMIVLNIKKWTVLRSKALKPLRSDIVVEMKTELDKKKNKKKQIKSLENHDAFYLFILFTFVYTR